MIRRFHRRTDGSVAIELALLTPIFMMIMWFGAEASYHYRFENGLHRAAATLADMFANLDLDEDEVLTERIEDLTPSALLMARQMLNAPDEARVGLRIGHYQSKIPNTLDDPPPPAVFEAGSTCESALPALDLLAAEGGGALTTADNVAKAVLLRVEICYFGEERWALDQYIFPQNFSSDFVTLRKSW
ncbi:MAG: hypothetical protein LBP33_13160 [Candidatus Adiutrix sp.]|jgi:hypothetical protein|nr:hypothetical protein [Candidatus Adiutrix sp.]